MSDFAPVIITPIRNPGKITVGLFPGDDHPVVLEAASTLGSSTDFSPVTSFTRVALKNGGYRHSMQYPVDGVRRYFRARHKVAGWTAGAYTRTVSAIPTPATVALSTDDGWEWTLGGQDDPAPLSEAIMKEEGVIRTTGQEVGTLSASNTITKTLIFPAAAYAAHSNSSTDSYFERDANGQWVGTDGVTFGGGGFAFEMFNPMTVPVGVTITQIETELYKNTTVSGNISLNIRQSTSSTGTPNTLTTLDVGSTLSSGWGTHTSTVMTHLVAEGDMFFAELQMSAASTLAGNIVRAGAIKMTYTMPSYEDSY